jgi:rubrerythrin
MKSKKEIEITEEVNTPEPQPTVAGYTKQCTHCGYTKHTVKCPICGTNEI